MVGYVLRPKKEKKVLSARREHVSRMTGNGLRITRTKNDPRKNISKVRWSKWEGCHPSSHPAPDMHAARTRGERRGRYGHIAPLMRILRYFVSKACASWDAAGLQSRIFSLSGLLGFVNRAAEWSARNVRAASSVSNASSSRMKLREIVRYLSRKINRLHITIQWNLEETHALVATISALALSRSMK